MQQLLLIIHVLAAIGIVALVLLQHGKGSDVGAAFGSGSSNTMFGSQGALPFLAKLTAVLAFVFYLTSISFSYLASENKDQIQSQQDALVAMPASSSDAANNDVNYQPEADGKTKDSSPKNQ